MRALDFWMTAMVVLLWVGAVGCATTVVGLPVSVGFGWMAVRLRRIQRGG